MKQTLILTSIFISLATYADDKNFSGSTEASVVVVSGNVNNETYSAKTDDKYLLTESDSLQATGSYTKVIAVGQETGKSWDAGLRYERIFMKDVLAGYLKRNAESDPYNGVFIQRDTTEAGLKYTITNSDLLKWSVELGYTYNDTYSDMGAPRKTAGFIRGFSEATYKISASTSSKLWLEHLSPLKSEDKSRTNAEVSISVSMTDIFSLKAAYLLNHDEAAVSPAKKDTTKLTTALVAKY